MARGRCNSGWRILCCPVAQPAVRPALTREVDGATPSGASIFMEVKADERAAAGWKPVGPAVRVVEHVHWLPFWVASIVAMQRAFNSQSTGQNRGDSPFFQREAEPDERAGTASKADRAPCAHGEHLLRLPPFHAGLAEQSCTRLVNEIRPVRPRQPAHRFSPVAQPAERPTLNREVDGANPSGAATFIAAHQLAVSRAGRSISRSPHRHCGGRRGRTAPAHHFKAPVAQQIRAAGFEPDGRGCKSYR